MRLVFTDTISYGYGTYQVVATLTNTETGSVSSLRDFSVLTPQQAEDRRNLALGQPVKASSVASKREQTGKAEFAVDGDRSTGWMSGKGDRQWLAVDLGGMKTISMVEVSVGTRLDGCVVEVSDDGINWKEVYSRKHAIPGIFSYVDVFSFTPAPARWVRIMFTGQDKEKAYVINEFVVYH